MYRDLCKPQSVCADLPPKILMGRGRVSGRYTSTDEPDLCDMLSDPLLQSLLDSDGVQIDRLKDLIAYTRTHLRR